MRRRWDHRRGDRLRDVCLHHLHDRRFAILAALAVQSLVQPSVMAMLIPRTPETQGEVQGIASMTTGIAGVIAPMVLTWPMAWFTGPAAPVHFPGVPFLISTGFADRAAAASPARRRARLRFRTGPTTRASRPGTPSASR
jgi:hypothetical protein